MPGKKYIEAWWPVTPASNSSDHKPGTSWKITDNLFQRSIKLLCVPIKFFTKWNCQIMSRLASSLLSGLLYLNWFHSTCLSFLSSITIFICWTHNSFLTYSFYFFRTNHQASTKDVPETSAMTHDSLNTVILNIAATCNSLQPMGVVQWNASPASKNVRIMLFLYMSPTISSLSTLEKTVSSAGCQTELLVWCDIRCQSVVG